MSTNCITCGVNRRTGMDLLCDECRHAHELKVFDTMQQFGGSFVQALADAWRRADQGNSLRLHGAFPHYFREYAAMVERPEKIHVIIRLDREELGGLLAAAKMQLAGMVGEGPYIDGLRRALARLTVEAEKIKAAIGQSLEVPL